jgi:hypothetical protein
LKLSASACAGISSVGGGLWEVLALTAVLSGCHTLRDEQTATRWITTKQPLTLLSANDGQMHLKLDAAHTTSNVPMKLDRNLTWDSITVVHLGLDHPPVVKTVYGTVPNTIALVPYASISRDSRYGFDLDVAAVPEGIEFTADGSQLFVQVTFANYIAVFEVDGPVETQKPVTPLTVCPLTGSSAGPTQWPATLS